MDNNQGAMKIKKMIIPERRSLFSRVCLPMLLFVSFVWLNLYASLSDFNGALFLNEGYSSPLSYMITSVLILSLSQYILFEILFFIYRLFIGFSIYSFMIPKNALLDRFRIWYIVRNLILGFVFNIRFFFPYISTYLSVVEIIMNFAFVIVLYFDLKKDYVEPLVGQYVFKTLVFPVILYEIYIVITQVVNVLWWRL